MITNADVLRAAASMYKAAAAGTLSAGDIEAQVIEEMRVLFHTVHGPGDPLWPMQLDVCRSVLERGGLPSHELAEWTAVQRQREGA